MTKRRSMHLARKRRIWTRENGVCFYRCGVPVPPPPAKGVVYHHFPALALLDEDLDEKVFPAHAECDAKPENTPADISMVAKADRTGKKHRGEWRPTRHQIPAGRSLTHPTLKRGFGGKVTKR